MANIFFLLNPYSQIHHTCQNVPHSFELDSKYVLTTQKSYLSTSTISLVGRVWCSCASGVPRLNPVSWTFPVPTRHLPLTSCHIYTVLSKTKWQKKENISSHQHFKQKRLWRMGSSGVGMEVGGQTRALAPKGISMTHPNTPFPCAASAPCFS